jgi:Cytochrome bd terminal oxidase subunit I
VYCGGTGPLAQRYRLDDTHSPLDESLCPALRHRRGFRHILPFEIGLLWPTFTKFSGSIIGLPFALEGFAFFLEAIFLGLYLYGWDRLSPHAHWLCSFLLWIGGAASAWFIVSANSWMNTPTGFQILHGQVTGINPLQAILNPSTPYETTHMLLAAYVATGFGAAAVYAIQILRGKREAYYRRGLLLAMALGAIAIPFQIFSGDLSARSLVDLQPAKLVAMLACRCSYPRSGCFSMSSGARILHRTFRRKRRSQLPHNAKLLRAVCFLEETPGVLWQFVCFQLAQKFFYFQGYA